MFDYDNDNKLESIFLDIYQKFKLMRKVCYPNMKKCIFYHDDNDESLLLVVKKSFIFAIMSHEGILIDMGIYIYIYAFLCDKKSFSSAY